MTDKRIALAEKLNASRKGVVGILGTVSLAALLAACGPTVSQYPEQIAGSEQHDPLGENTDAGRGNVFGGGEDGYLVVGGDRDKQDGREEHTTERDEISQVDPAAAQRAAVENRKMAQKRLTKVAGDSKRVGIAVNEYLWRSTLETISFMPLVSADPFGGLVLTDWHANPEVPNERYKVQVYILSKELRADALKVAMFRQERQNGQWVDAAVSPDTRIKLENAILTKARQLRVSNMDN